MYIVTAKVAAWEEDFPGSRVEWKIGQSREVHDSLVEKFKRNPSAWTVSGGNDSNPIQVNKTFTGRIRNSIGANGITGVRNIDRAPNVVVGDSPLLADFSIVAGTPSISIAQDSKGRTGLRIVCNVGENTEIKIPALAGHLFAGEVFLQTDASYVGGVNQVLAYVTPDAARAMNVASAAFTPWFSVPLNSALEPSPEAKTYRLGKAELSITGTITYPFVTDYVSLRFIPRAGFAPTIFVYGVGFSAPAKKGRICVTVDDGYDSWFKLGQPIFDERGIPVTMAVIPVNMDTGNGNAYLRQLRSFVNRKNAVVAHGPNITAGIGSLISAFTNNADRVADAKGARDWIAANSLDTPNFEQCYVWPQGAWQSTYADGSLIDALISEGFTTGRAVANGSSSTIGINFDALGKHQHMTLPIIGHTWAGSTASEATNITAITTAITNVGAWKTDAALMFHRVSPTSTNDAGMTAASISIRQGDLTTIADAIAAQVSAGNVDAVVMPQLVSGGSANYWQQ